MCLMSHVNTSCPILLTSFVTLFTAQLIKTHVHNCIKATDPALTAEKKHALE